MFNNRTKLIINVTRYKKAVSTTVWLQLTLVACYLPNGVVMALVVYDGQ